MPNRFLKESVCTSATIDQLKSDEEVFFYRLIVNCDDYGLMDARPAVLRARLFPLRTDRITDEHIARYLTKLEAVGLIHLYEARGQPYLKVATWERHQQTRASKPKYPFPPNAKNGVSPTDSSESEPLSPSANNGYQVITNAPVFVSGPVFENVSGDPETVPHGTVAPVAAAPRAARKRVSREARHTKAEMDALVTALVTEFSYQEPLNQDEQSLLRGVACKLLDSQLTPADVGPLAAAILDGMPFLETVTAAMLPKNVRYLRNPPTLRAKSPNGRAPPGRPVDRSSMSKIDPSYAEDVLASMNQNGKEAKRESRPRAP